MKGEKPLYYKNLRVVKNGLDFALENGLRDGGETSKHGPRDDMAWATLPMGSNFGLPC